MFVDRIQVKLIAGKGGGGIVAWRREKYLPKGGPFGGNGGRGGGVVLQADPSLNCLQAYRNRTVLRAQNGAAGGPNLRQGRSGNELIVRVPFGTLVKEQETGQILHDFTPDHPRWIACQGGKGGLGNAHFKTATNRAPTRCTPGRAGEQRAVELELKLLAQVGLVGMPNAGKSTLMRSLTHARTKVGAYPFTTLIPSLSWVQCPDDSHILIADIPGIIEHAHQNKGLGLAFLRHIERTSALVFTIDASGGEQRDPFDDFCVLRREIGAYDPTMLKRPYLVALNKADIATSSAHIAAFSARFQGTPEQVCVISAKEQAGLDALVAALQHVLPEPVPNNAQKKIWQH